MTDKNKGTEVARLYFEVSAIMKRGMHKRFERSGITLPQGMVLATLITSGKMKITALSEKIGLSNSTISGIVDRLEKQQLVERVRSEQDRRVVYVKTTPKVEEIHQGIHRQAEEHFADLLSSGGPEEIETILAGLNTLKRILVLSGTVERM